jgi:hypothetical protein
LTLDGTIPNAIVVETPLGWSSFVTNPSAVGGASTPTQLATVCIDYR